MAEDHVPPFDEFASSHGLKPRGICSVCKLPAEVRQQLGVARERGFGPKAMAQYLEATGYPDVKGTHVNNHITRGHDW